jgi:hypothetical protein
MATTNQDGRVTTAAFTATGQSAVNSALRGDYNASIWATFVGTVALERSFDGGTTWLSVKSVTAPTETAGYEPENGTSYRFNVTAYTSGTVNVRFGQNR